MEIDAFLCDHAEAVGGKLFVNGAGINIVWTSPQPPHMINVCVAAVVQVPYTATNQPHTVSVTLRDEDSNLVQPWSPDATQEAPPIHVQTEFNVGRPPLLPAGEAQVIPLVFGFQVPLVGIGLYSFSIEIDADEVKRLPLRLMVMNQQASPFAPPV